MTDFDIAAIRLMNQQLIDPTFNSAKELVSHFGAMQAQDYPMSKWAIGCRLPGATDQIIEKSLDDGEIIRTHVLRPTWHLAAAEDICWLLELTAPNILRQFKSMNAKLGLDSSTFAKAGKLIAKALEGGNELTREEIVAILNQNGIKTNEYRGISILAYAELHREICSGKRKGKHHTYALFSERVPNAKSKAKQVALAELGKRYFTSHGPASLKDFTWWSGLSVADAKHSIDLNQEILTEKEHQGQKYYWIDYGNSNMPENVLLLPAFDEYLIAYKDRSASIHLDHMPHAFTVNGIFKPLIVINGQVVGIWKRTIKNNSVMIEPTFFQKVSKTAMKQVTYKSDEFAHFLGLKREDSILITKH